MAWDPELARYAKDFTFDAGAIVVLLLFVGFARRRLSARAHAWAFVLVALLLALFCARGAVEVAALPLLEESGALTAHSRASGCERDYPVVVVLSGGILSPELPAEVTLQRVLTSVRLALQSRGAAGRRSLVFSGGFNHAAGDAEATVMARYFRLLAGDKAGDVHLYAETRSANTYENALFTKSLLDRYHLGHRIVLVTSSLHLPRSVATFRKAGFEVCPWAAPSPEVRSHGAVSFFNASRLRGVLNEYLGFAGYFLRGWI